MDMDGCAMRHTEEQSADYRPDDDSCDGAATDAGGAVACLPGLQDACDSIRESSRCRRHSSSCPRNSEVFLGLSSSLE